jgi:hypothetical protein
MPLPTLPWKPDQAAQHPSSHRRRATRCHSHRHVGIGLPLHSQEDYANEPTSTIRHSTAKLAMWKPVDGASD